MPAIPRPINDRAIQLRKANMSIPAIIESIQREFGVHISQSALYSWFNATSPRLSYLQSNIIPNDLIQRAIQLKGEGLILREIAVVVWREFGRSVSVTGLSGAMKRVQGQQSGFAGNPLPAESQLPAPSQTQTATSYAPPLLLDPPHGAVPYASPLQTPPPPSWATPPTYPSRELPPGPFKQPSEGDQQNFDETWNLVAHSEDWNRRYGWGPGRP